MRETCAHFSDAADEANFLARPFLVLLAELISRIFGKIEDIVLLWRAGLIPPPAPKPEKPQRPHARRKTRRTRRTPKKHRTPGLRPNPVNRPQSARTRPAYARPSDPPPRESAPVRRIDRYPKPSKNTAKSRRICTPNMLR
jgi:hypothetical protein